MLSDPDLSAVIASRQPESLKESGQKTKKGLFELKIGILDTQKTSTNEEKLNEYQENYEPNIKKTKISDYEYMIVEKDCPNVKKIVVDVYSMLQKDVKEKDKIKSIDDTTLINAFTKGIFGFALTELSSEVNETDMESTRQFREFFLDNYDKINDLTSIKWIWTIDENDNKTMADCKRKFIEYSMKFFSNEEVILQWIEDPEIRRIIRNVYDANKDTFKSCLLLPLLNFAANRQS